MVLKTPQRKFEEAPSAAAASNGAAHDLPRRPGGTFSAGGGAAGARAVGAPGTRAVGGGRGAGGAPARASARPPPFA